MAATNVCYRKLGGVKTQSFTASPCGIPTESNPYVPCCHLADFCLSDNLCKYTHPYRGGSGYYVAGSTDPSYNDSSASTHCTNLVWPDAVNTGGNTWACCNGANFPNGEGRHPTCKVPTQQKFRAPAPSNLKTMTSLPAATPTSSTSTSASASSPASTASSGLSSGAKAGIGVGVSVGVLLLLAFLCLAWWFTRRRSKGAAVSGGRAELGAFTRVGAFTKEGAFRKVDSSESDTVRVDRKEVQLEKPPELHTDANRPRVHEVPVSSFLPELPADAEHEVSELPVDTKK